MNNWKIKNSSDLYINPSFLRGVSRLGDLFGTLDEYNYKEDADEEAIRRDWAIVGQDIKKSIELYDRQKKSNKEKKHK